jgi:ribosomal protein L11
MFQNKLSQRRLIKVKASLRLRIEAGVLKATPKLSTSIGQQRILIQDFFDVLEEKLLGYDFVHKLPIKVVLLVYTNSSYSIFIKYPILNTILLRLSRVKKLPGRKELVLLRCTNNKYIVTPYMLYEAVFYYYSYKGINWIFLRKIYKSIFNSARHFGIHVYKC